VITQEQIDELKLVIACAGKLNETLPQFALLCQLISEHAAMREQLRWREQAKESASENESPIFAKRANGSNFVDYPGCGESECVFWLPIPPLNKE
jgi:hypothetical protein